MSVTWNGVEMSTAQYRALKIQEFMKEDWRFIGGGDNQGAALLHLIAQLLPGDPVANTGLVTNGMQRKVFEQQHLKDAILDLLEDYCDGEDCVENTRTIQHVPGLRTCQGVSVTKVTESEWESVRAHTEPAVRARGV